MRFRLRIFLSCGCLLLLFTVVDWLLRLKDEREMEFLKTGHLFNQSSGANWGMVVEQRSQWLSDVCKSKNLWGDTHVSELALDNIFVSDRHNILFCQTPDGDDDEWKKLLIALSGTFSSVEEIPEKLVHDYEKNGLPRLSSLTPQEIRHRLKNYFKFFIVRDPFERLISTFEGKFLFNKPSEPWYKYTIGPALIRKYRKSSHHLRDTGLVFDEFVQYLGDEDGRKAMDWQFGQHIIHWAPYMELCTPCDIHYDVIGHLETLEQDTAHILRRAGIEQLGSYPPISPGIAHYNKTKVERYFSGISKKDIRRLYARYQGDFYVFGYPTPGFLLN
ncbi:carbohydrate sulfotransferase 10-like [Hippocampus comes]|uniref:carbohydrate sulfotransferase 10-like n=1 Tax=Hippocampus comes TaxID=109280 RepID=UPI00094DFEE7|nr:PREDICTED: carbohydrate sulfotransferase 10-like [Hippocampus comes]XP_019734100.1 PREDICTED: carbohydrate sulfotransferase 10-like [Hippocampus comes]